MSMKHRGYSGSVEFDPDDRIFHGRVRDIADVVTFQGSSVDELEASFRSSVDVYLAGCEKHGLEPQHPCSGRLLLRLPADVHREVSVAARRGRTSINRWIRDAVQARLEREKPVPQRSRDDEDDAEDATLPDAAGG